MQLARLVVASQRVTETPKRGEKVAILADLFRVVPIEAVPIVVGLLSGAPRQGRLGIGWSTLIECRAAPADVSSLTIGEVDQMLTHISGLSGVGSQTSRRLTLTLLMHQSTLAEQEFLVRALAGEMHQGANELVIADAIAKAADVPTASFRRAAMLLGDIAKAASMALAGQSLDEIGIVPLVGVQPMLAGTSASVAEALQTTGPASIEWKLDGARIQVHRSGEQVRVLTRTLNDITTAVPDVVRAAMSLPLDQFVLDGEALGLRTDGGPLPFQDSMSVGSRLQPFFFDALQVDGRSLIDEPLLVRKALLADAIPEQFRLPSIDTSDPDLAEQFGRAALLAGHEGVMVKALDSTYQAGRRGTAWRKVKPVHTLDLVVIAAEWGHGRRVGWLSNLHLAARGDQGSFVMVGKTFKGLTDDLLKWQTEQLQTLALATEFQQSSSTHVVHVRPELVVEIAVDGVQRSTRYAGGVALRFARVRRYRLDKQPGTADTIERVRQMLANPA